ncbi:MAG: 50S ribosomal protein L11 methyltransferase [Rikenellaceae bacterium]|nr:50S ribosomal protein L11 methyltransferase [Rikenellaceae bacterium]
MDYVELNIPCTSAEQSEILVAELAEWPFESFENEGTSLKAYIQRERLVDCMGEVDALLASYGVEGARYIEIETQNWNALWESNFTPVDVEGKILIRAPFHPAQPDYRLEVVIMPKMSFGTGHHATTYLMSREMIGRDYTGRVGLDMGSGTGVLAIIAAKFGAERVDAVDIDDWAYENCIENIAQNGVSDRVVPILGDASAIEGKQYDFILANINRNILIADMPRYAAALRSGGELYMSGILERDVEDVRLRAAEFGIEMDGARFRNGWAVMRCVKR